MGVACVGNMTTGLPLGRAYDIYILYIFIVHLLETRRAWTCKQLKTEGWHCTINRRMSKERSVM